MTDGEQYKMRRRQIVSEGYKGLLGSLLGRKSDRDNTTEDGEPNEYLALAEANPYDD